MTMQKKQPSAPQDSKRQPREETHLEGLASITSMLIIWSFVMGFVLQNFVIPSSSMASTLLVGDHVIVERATLAPASSWTNLIPYRELRGVTNPSSSSVRHLIPRVSTIYWLSASLVSPAIASTSAAESFTATASPWTNRTQPSPPPLI